MDDLAGRSLTESRDSMSWLISGRNRSGKAMSASPTRRHWRSPSGDSLGPQATTCASDHVVEPVGNPERLRPTCRIDLALQVLPRRPSLDGPPPVSSRPGPDDAQVIDPR